MLALITEKLQNQSLQDAAAAAAAASAASVSAATSTATAPRFTQQPREDCLKTTPSQSGLAVKGKNVWSMSLGERDCPAEGERAAVAGAGGGGGGGGGGKVARIAEKPQCSPLCRHKKSAATCCLCDCVPGTPTAPPKKKHCRSLSVPADAPPDPPRLCRPIAVIPITNNNILHKNRNLVGRFPSDFKVVGSGPAPGSVYPGYGAGHGQGGGVTFPSLAPSPLSSDSGHFTVSDLTTPPGSPVPRPASTTSDTSHGSPWLDQSPYRVNRFEVLQNRSLSCEDNILSAAVIAGSTPCMAGSATSTPASPCRHRIPRCRSQPCVLHERKCGKKRRRPHANRPALNFQKMAETAYVQLPQSEPVQVPVSEYEKGPCRIRLEVDPSLCLMPIASSPVDTEASPVAKRSHHCPSPQGELQRAAGIALPPSPPQSLHFPHRQFIPADPSGEEEEEEDSECGCHGDQMEDGTELFPLTDLDLEQIENH